MGHWDGNVWNPKGRAVKGRIDLHSYTRMSVMWIDLESSFGLMLGHKEK